MRHGTGYTYRAVEITTPDGNFGTFGQLFEIDLTKFMTSKY